MKIHPRQAAIDKLTHVQRYQYRLLLGIADDLYANDDSGDEYLYAPIPEDFTDDDLSALTDCLPVGVCFEGDELMLHVRT